MRPFTIWDTAWSVWGTTVPRPRRMKAMVGPVAGAGRADGDGIRPQEEDRAALLTSRATSRTWRCLPRWARVASRSADGAAAAAVQRRAGAASELLPARAQLTDKVKTRSKGAWWRKRTWL